MEVSVTIDETGKQPGPGQVLVLAVSNTCLATTSSEWGVRREWHRLLPSEHLADSFGAHYLVLSTAHVDGTPKAISIMRINMIEHLSVVAMHCDEHTDKNGHKCTSDAMVFETKDGVRVLVSVRMEQAMFEQLKELKIDHCLIKNPVLKKDHVTLDYRIGKNRCQPYARWAAASYGELHYSVTADVSISRFCRQVELAGLLFGCNLENAELSFESKCRLAAELFTMPLRAHGIYTPDGECDRPTMPFFGERNHMAAFDCEDAAMFVVSEMMYFWTLMASAEKTLSKSVKSSNCNPGSVENIVEILRLAAQYVPLHVVLRQGDSSELHAAVMLLAPRQLRYLFGAKWKKALPADRRKLPIDTAVGLPPRYVDACTLLSDTKPMRNFGVEGVFARDKRFRHALTRADKIYGKLRMVGVYGAEIAVDLDGQEKVKIDLELVTLLETLRLCAEPAHKVPAHPNWRTFTYKCPGALTLLPGPDMPLDQLSIKPVAVSRETADTLDKVVITRDPGVNATFKLQLFTSLPCASMICAR